MKVTGSYPIAYESRGHCNKNDAVTRWVATRKSEYSLSSHVQDGTQGGRLFVLSEKCQAEIFCPAKSEIYKKKRQVPQKEENDDRFKIFKRESGSCKTEY